MSGAYSAIIPVFEFADRLRKARSITGLGQREFADVIGVKAPSIASWEAGNAKPRDIVALAKRVEMLTRVPASWLLGVDGTNPSPDGGSCEWCARRDSNPKPSGQRLALVRGAVFRGLPLSDRPVKAA
ncbi:Helix-turn-helix domain [Mycobacteroides abscessus subsp. massiliense]|nr:Helix-turn-helix domain [Mycobacteroides abscessus subsp. massiliense]